MVTGGAGSLGKVIVREIFKEFPSVGKVVIYSRDELKHHQMGWEFSSADFRIDYVIGDVRDRDRLQQAMEGIDVVIHAAAMKQVGTCEMNPEECYKTNVSGTQNLIKSAKYQQVSQILLVSTDKAVDPVSVYGNSKQAAERLFIKADSKELTSGIVRLGNLMGSAGSVIPLFNRLKDSGEIPITHPDMTRFGGSILEGAKVCLYALENMRGGEIFVPKWPSFRIGDLAEALAPGCRQKLIGVRKHEKMHEVLVSIVERDRLVENEKNMVITKDEIDNDEALSYYKSLKVNSSVHYMSKDCPRFEKEYLESLKFSKTEVLNL